MADNQEDVFGGDPTKTVLDELVGEGKKFKTVEDLAAGKKAADDHIAGIEQENSTLKQELDRLKSSGDTETRMADLVDAVRKAQGKKDESNEGEQTALSQEELIETIRSVVQGDKQATTKASNRQIGNELVLKLVDGNADAARQLVTERAEALGMSPKALAELSETSPDAFASLIGTSGSTGNSGSTASLPKHRTDALYNGSDRPMELVGDDGASYKTKAYFDAKKKELGHVKYLNDQQTQRELAKSINGLGSRFSN